MKYFILFFIFSIFSTQDKIDPSKILIIYYSRTGNTELFVNYIKENIDIESYKIIPATPYPENYNEMLDLARNEQSTNARPEIKDPLTDISDYDIILLGYPLWHGHIPNIIITQLELLNLNGKTIYPFNTHGSSGISNSVNDIKQYAKGADVKSGFALSGNLVKNNKESAMSQISSWIENNFPLEETKSSTVSNTISSTITNSEPNPNTETVTSSLNKNTEKIDDEDEEDDVAQLNYSKYVKNKDFLIVILLFML